jgi:hypothetical protein
VFRGRALPGWIDAPLDQSHHRTALIAGCSIGRFPRTSAAWRANSSRIYQADVTDRSSTGSWRAHSPTGRERRLVVALLLVALAATLLLALAVGPHPLRPPTS